MKKFSKSFNIETTWVKFYGPSMSRWHKVVFVNDTGINIKVEKLGGSWQRGHVSNYTNIEPLEKDKA